MRRGSCGCSGSGGGCTCPSSGVLDTGSPGLAPAGAPGALWTPGGGAPGAFDPFPRQTLVGSTSVPPTAVYYSPVFDAAGWKSLAYWFQVYQSLPPPVTGLTVATAYIQTSSDLLSPVWEEMVSGGIDVDIGSPPQTGAVDDPSAFVRVAVELLLANQVATVAFRMVGRER